MLSRLRSSGLADIAEKLDRGARLGLEDGRRLFDSPDLLAVGWLANREREKRHGPRTFYNYNIRLEATNVCVASCLFCSFARLKPGDTDAYTMTLEQVWDKLRQRAHQPLTEIHVVNGLHPDLPFDYYTEMLRGFKRIRPDIHLKCFTAVEIAFFADLYGMTDEQVLRELMAAGLDSLPGGGAEIFAERVRRKIAHDKCGTERYLEIHRTAHRLGMRTNVTMLYGHIETSEERVDHMLRARALQDETGGFQAFIPLAFHPDNNQMRQLPAPSAADTLRVHAVARLMCDNIDHVKAFWIATGVRWRRPACGSAPTTLTAPCRKRRFTTWPGRGRRRRCRRARSNGSSARRGANPSSATRYIEWSSTPCRVRFKRPRHHGGHGGQEVQTCSKQDFPPRPPCPSWWRVQSCNAAPNGRARRRPALEE
jgi:aminodeoxyfutalosine synthase